MGKYYDEKCSAYLSETQFTAKEAEKNRREKQQRNH